MALLQGASDRVDERVEPQPLWEYPGRPLTDEFGLIDLDLQQALSGLRRVTRQGSIALWRCVIQRDARVSLDRELYPLCIVRWGRATECLKRR